MSVNRYQPHVLVLPEDDANRQLANGFIQDGALSGGKIQVLTPAGGWLEVLDRFQSDNLVSMDRYPARRIVLLIDFDGRPDRLAAIKNRIPPRLTDRVFVLGVWTEPEALKRATGDSFEKIGKAMARDCREGTSEIWNHELPQNNSGEISRLREDVQRILFPPVS